MPIAPAKASMYGVTVVTGEPGAGKTTYVREHAKPSDLVYDLDEMAKALNPRWENYQDRRSVPVNGIQRHID